MSLLCHVFEEKHVSGSYLSFQVGKHGSHTHTQHLLIHVLNMRKVEKQNQKSELKRNVHIYLHGVVPGTPVECVKTHPLKVKPFSFCQICCMKMEEADTTLHI